jgi:hypothetical protein
MCNYLIATLIAICVHIPVVAQVKLIPIRDLSIATEALGIHASNLQLINGLFYAPAFNKLIVWDTTGREVNRIAHHYTRNRVNQNYFCRFLTVYGKDYYISYYSWDYVHVNRLSDGKRILVTRIGNEKNKYSDDYAYPVQKINGTKIVIAGNDFVSPQAIIFKDRLIIPYRALAFLKSAKNKQGIINHHLTEYDTLNYLPGYPLFGIYDLKPMVNQLAERINDAPEIKNNHLLPYVNTIGTWSESYLKQGRKKQYYQFPDLHGMAYDMNTRDSIPYLRSKY